MLAHGGRAGFGGAAKGDGLRKNGFQGASTQEQEVNDKNEKQQPRKNDIPLAIPCNNTMKSFDQLNRQIRRNRSIEKAWYDEDTA